MRWLWITSTSVGSFISTFCAICKNLTVLSRVKAWGNAVGPAQVAFSITLEKFRTQSGVNSWGTSPSTLPGLPGSLPIKFPSLLGWISCLRPMLASIAPIVPPSVPSPPTSPFIVLLPLIIAFPAVLAAWSGFTAVEHCCKFALPALGNSLPIFAGDTAPVAPTEIGDRRWSDSNNVCTSSCRACGWRSDGCPCIFDFQSSPM